MTYTKFLGSGMKCETSETCYHNLYNEIFNSFTISLHDLCKTLPIIFAESSSPFHSLCALFIWSYVSNLEYIALTSGCIWFPSRMSSRSFLLIDPSSGSSSVDDSSIEAENYSSSTTLRSKSNKIPLFKVWKSYNITSFALCSSVRTR